MSTAQPAPSQRELVLASLRRGVGSDNCAGAKHGHGSSVPKPAAGQR